MGLKSAKQKMFVKEYLIDLNATQAAARAGYKDPNFGRQLLTKTNVSIEIQKALKARAEKIGLTAEKVLTDIQRIKEDAMSMGESGKMVDRSAALKACELEGRHLKMFTDKIDMNAKIGMEETLDDLA